MDDLPTPTEQHSKFALKMMLDNLTLEQKKAYETNGRFTVYLQGKTYLISRIADNPVPPYDLATIEKEIRSLNLDRFSNGFHHALQETVARWRGELESRQSTKEFQQAVDIAMIAGTLNIKPGHIVIPPHPFAKRNKP